MWPRRSHTLIPLTKITSINNIFKWTQIKDDALEKIKWIVAQDNLLNYPEFNETFKIRTDARAFQLGAVIRQKGNHIDLNSIKLNDAQQWFTVMQR